jgi:leucyl-tRNA---protein transferase
MFARVHTPVKIASEELDDYLLKGWFRMGQNIFTTNFLNFKNHFYSAIWLRLRLENYSGDNTEHKLRKINSRFRSDISRFSITTEKEELFARYRQNISFEASSSLYQLMFGKAFHNVYNTMEVNLYDSNKLIACGFFDLGCNSAAGITSFYDPDYKKYSLGKFLIYLKIKYCKENGLQYFYPGYFVPGYSFFDYKLSIGKNSLEFLELSSSDWMPVKDFNPLLSPIRIMQEKLTSMQILLAQSKIEAKLFRYEFFEANLLPELKDVDLFDFPLFLYINSSIADAQLTVLVYDVREEQFLLVKCRSLWTSTLSNENDMFSSELLQQERVVLMSSNPDEIAGTISLEAHHRINKLDD